MFKSLNKLGTGLSKAVDQVGKDINKAIDENWKSTLLYGIMNSVGRAVDKAVVKLDRTCNDAFFGPAYASSLLKSLKNRAVDSMSKGIASVTQSVDDFVTGSVAGPTKVMADNFRSGNVIQLISRSSGHSLQIVTAPTGQLVVDGLGPLGPEYMHAHWTILNEGKNIVRLHNQNNYLAIVNGTTCILQFPDPSCTTPETRFRLHQTANFMAFESVKNPKQHIGILREGTLKAAVATGTEIDAQFGVQVIYSPYGQPAGAAAGPVRK